MSAKIYIIPDSGKYEGKLLVFDTVESMSHIRSSKIPQHPVESLNRSRADHRFREGAKIQLTGAISDNWDTQITDEPRPAFKTLANKEQVLIRDKIQNEFPRGTVVNKVINQILDKKDPRPEDLEIVNSAEFNGQVRGPFWLAKAERALEVEKDSLDIAQQKQLSQVGSRSNDYSQGFNINTITQAKELLKDLDENSVLVTVVSMFEIYENMVLSNFTNVLRNGPQRGAYWVSLTLEEQLLARTVTNPIVVDSTNSEEVGTGTNLGKKSRQPIDKNDKIYKTVQELYKIELKLVADSDPSANTRDPKIESKVKNATNEKSEEALLQDASRAYGDAGGEAAPEASRVDAIGVIRARLAAISTTP